MVTRSKQATATLAALHDLDHPTADEVFQAVRQEMPRVSLATVYRNLDGLVDQGMAQVRQVGGLKRYDPVTEPHAHLHCVRCDRLLDAPIGTELDAQLRALAASGGLDYEGALLEVRGLCPDCKQ